MCFAQSHFPQKSRFFLPSSFDPHGTGGDGVEGGLACVNSLVFQLEGPADPHSVTHCSLSTLDQQTTMWRCQLPWPKNNSAREQPSLDNICKQKVRLSLGAKVTNICRALLKMMWTYFGWKFSCWVKCYCRILCWVHDPRVECGKCSYLKYVSPERNILKCNCAILLSCKC